MSKKKDAEAYGPGHNGFFKSKDGSEDWLVYHANNLVGQGCGDSRNPRIQKFTWNADDTPNFGTPVAINKP
ncbi:MAG: family 43 glycosylhydrolase [Hymenobacter sp.]